MWECVYHNDAKFYFANYTDSKVVISDGEKTVFEYPNVNINGCTFNGFDFWYSVEGNNEIIRIDSQKQESVMPVLPYDAVRILKMVTKWSHILVAEGIQGGEKELFLFGGVSGHPMCVFPYAKTGFIDFVLTDEHHGHLLCDQPLHFPQRPDTRRLLYAELEWREEERKAYFMRSIFVDTSGSEPVLTDWWYSERFASPLFGTYLKKLPLQKSFSSHGNFVVYYSEEIHSVIIGNPVSYPAVDRVVALPDEAANSAFEYYFDEVSQELFVIALSESIHIRSYRINCVSDAAIIKLNSTCHKAFKQNIKLFELPERSYAKYDRILKRAISSCTCTSTWYWETEPLERTQDANHSQRVTLAVKTPIPGKVLLDKPWNYLGYIGCNNDFEKMFSSDVSEERFTLLFEAKTCTKEIPLWRPFDDKTLQVDMSIYLSDDEIAPCCDRAAVRRRLQRDPTDPYALYQMRRVGNEEDLNFLQGILEDEIRSYGYYDQPNSEYIWNLFNAIFRLSLKYQCIIDYSLAMYMEKIVTESVANRICNCIAYLNERRDYGWKYWGHSYRVDFLVSAYTDNVKIYLDSKDHLFTELFWEDQPAEIDGTKALHKKNDWCYLRTDSKKFSLIFETAYGDEVLPMDVQNNDAHSRQEITLKPPVFNRKMAKKVLRKREDGILAIPDGFKVLADDFARLLEQTDPDYDANDCFYEIRIPASVTTVGSLNFADEPESLHDSRFEEFVVAEENPAFCSIDGVLFTKDRKKLIRYPCGKQGAGYTVPDGVEVLGEHSFEGNPFLKRVCLPSSVKVIERAAFSSCEVLEQVTLPEGLEVLGESAFELCSIHHLTFPRSLRKIHWTNLSGGYADIWNLEIPGAPAESPVEIDMSGFSARWEDSFVPPLFLLNGKNDAFETYARRHKRNLIRGFTVDEADIVWADDGATLVEFPLHWPDEVYRVPDNVTGVFRWAFNECDVKRVVSSKKLTIVGRTASPVQGDLSKIDPQSERYDPNFLVTEEPTERREPEPPVEHSQPAPPAVSHETQPPADSTPGSNEIMASLKEIHEDLRAASQTAKVTQEIVKDTNRKVTSLVDFVKTDLQTWMAEKRPRVEDEEQIEQFAQKAAKYINEQLPTSDQDVQQAETHLRGLFGGTWDRLLLETQSSLISANVLWKMCANISTERFDYSGIVITSTSALESELKRVFYTGFQQYMVEKYGDPTQQDANKTYADWPEKLLSLRKAQYRQKAELPSIADHFTMGTLPYLFFDDKNSIQNDILVKRMGEYLSTIVREKYREAPVNVFIDLERPKNPDRFVGQCEKIREQYRNPAGHTDVMPRESAEECYEKIVGVEKMEAFQYTHEVEGLIMTLYSYLM